MMWGLKALDILVREMGINLMTVLNEKYAKAEDCSTFKKFYFPLLPRHIYPRTNIFVKPLISIKVSMVKNGKKVLLDEHIVELYDWMYGYLNPSTFEKM